MSILKANICLTGTLMESNFKQSNEGFDSSKIKTLQNEHDSSAQQVVVERPGALRAAAVVPQHVRGGVGRAAPPAVRATARPPALQGPRLQPAQEVPQDGTRVLEYKTY